MKALRAGVAAAAVCALAASALADGMIIVHPWRPIPGPRPRPGPDVMTTALEVKYHKVNVAITDQSAVTDIDQTFHNPVAAQLEGTYIFPLPDDVAVNRFTMYMDGKEVVGELLDKEKARQTYEDIVRKMKDPALLEYVGTRVYKARIFPIPAGGDVRVTLKYSQLCPADEGTVLYRYPLNTEKFSAKPLEEVVVTVSLTSQVPLKNVYSPSHKVKVVRKDDHAATVSYEDKNVTPSTDFLVYYAFSRKDFGLNLLTHRPSDAEPGYFLALISPKEQVDPSAIVPKDVVFVIDTSGSMNDDNKIKQARNALVYCLKKLRPDDRFNVVPFSSDPEPFHENLVAASETTVAEDVRRAGLIEAAGGTNINDTLLLALDVLDKAATDKDRDRPAFVVFLTDGRPTVGATTDPKDILAHVQKANTRRARLFVFGVGTDVNTTLLDTLSAQNRGVCTYVDPNEDIEVKVSSLYNKIAYPVLSDLAADFGVKTTDVYPRDLPDLFVGSQLMVLGRYSEFGDKAIRLAGKRQGKDWSDTYEGTFPRLNERNEFLPRLWAVRKIGYCLEQIRLHGEDKELKDEVVRLSKKYGIMTPYTSFLVMEDVATVRPGPGGRPGRPTPAPMMREALDAAAPRAQAGGGGFRGSTGGAAVDASKAINAFKFDAHLGDEKGGAAGQLRDAQGRDVIKSVADKTFYRQGDKWVDSAYDGQTQTTKVKYLSDDYFALVKDRPGLGKYLALGRQLIVVFGEKVYEITE